MQGCLNCLPILRREQDSIRPLARDQNGLVRFGGLIHQPIEVGACLICGNPTHGAVLEGKSQYVFGRDEDLNPVRVRG